MKTPPELTDRHLEHVLLFPLPNVVFFPRVRLPLHVFEPRYRDLVKDAVADERPVALPLLKPGYEEGYEGSPDIHDVAGVGFIVKHEPLPDGRSMILLHGVERVRILEEPPTEHRYRVARTAVMETEWPGEEALRQPVREIRDLALGMVMTHPQLAESMHMIHGVLDRPELLCDVVAAGFVPDVKLRQAILAEPRLDRRLRLAADGLAMFAADSE